MQKKQILERFLLNANLENVFQKYINLIIDYNLHTNLVGKSTLVDPWSSHILDCLQIFSFIKDKNASILDMGSGAGLPGNILSIAGCKNVTLVDSNGKKIKFLKNANKEMGLSSKLILSRIENMNNLKYDIVTSRALSKLTNLISYSQKFLKKNTVLIFLKGKTVNEEIQDAQKKWIFQINKHQSVSDPRGTVLVLRNLRKK